MTINDFCWLWIGLNLGLLAEHIMAKYPNFHRGFWTFDYKFWTKK